MARTGEQGGQRVATYPPSRFVALHSPRSPRPMLGMEGSACALSLFLRVSEHVRVVTRTLTLAERRGGRTALMAICPLDMLELSMFPFVSPPLMPVPLSVRGRRCHAAWVSLVNLV